MSALIRIPHTTSVGHPLPFLLRTRHETVRQVTVCALRMVRSQYSDGSEPAKKLSMGAVLNFCVALLSAAGLFMLLRATPRRRTSAVCFTAILFTGFGLAALTLSAISPDDDLLQQEFFCAKRSLGMSQKPSRATSGNGVSVHRSVVVGLATQRHVPPANTRVELLFATVRIFPPTNKRSVSACRAPPLISSPA